MSVETEKMSAMDKGIVDTASNSEVDNFADPDAGLTDEEKLAAVSP